MICSRCEKEAQDQFDLCRVCMEEYMVNHCK
jgi:hypothetical protein